MSSAFLDVQAISISYPGPKGDLEVIDQLSLQLAKGDIGCLLGASGCGKTTVLRAIAGFEPLRAGAIYLDGRLLSSTTEQIAPEKRQVGMMFQDYALFPHLTVEKNIGFGLRRWDKAKAARRIDDMIQLVGLQAERNRYPHELSGGQNQRVNIARAFISRPRLVACDEAVSALDARTRSEILDLLADLQKETGVALLFVTHDFHAVARLCHRTVVLHRGKVVDEGETASLMSHAGHPRTADLLAAIPRLPASGSTQ